MKKAKLSNKLENRLTSHAVHYITAKSNEERELHKFRVITITNRLSKVKPKLGEKASNFYKERLKDTEQTLNQLKLCASQYQILLDNNGTESAIKLNDESALEYIASIFCGSNRSIIKLFNFYKEMKANSESSNRYNDLGFSSGMLS